jgi:hypothetical protein
MIAAIQPTGMMTTLPATQVNLRCPVCRHAGVFNGIFNCVDAVWSEVRIARRTSTRREKITVQTGRAGLRLCPNAACGALVFVAVDLNTGKIVSFPQETIDFDATNLPDGILESLEEAIACHAGGCYRASSLMVRRVLEELCDDKGAIGKDLKARIAALGTHSAMVPKELLAAADELRILGNDAAHIEAKSYNDIGENEATLAIDLTKELLKAVYQYGALVDRLRKLKSPP